MPVFEQGYFDKLRKVVVKDKRTGRKVFDTKDHVTGGAATRILVLKRLFELESPKSMDEMMGTIVKWFDSGVLKPEYLSFDSVAFASHSLLGNLTALYEEVLDLYGIDYSHTDDPGLLEASLAEFMPLILPIVEEHFGSIDPFEFLEVEVVSEE